MIRPNVTSSAGPWMCGSGLEIMRATWRLSKRAPTTTLTFPNRSRAFDATRRAVRFWGHDRAMEVSFFVTEDALRRVVPDIGSNEAGFLAAVDCNQSGRGH